MSSLSLRRLLRGSRVAETRRGTSAWPRRRFPSRRGGRASAGQCKRSPEHGSAPRPTRPDAHGTVNAPPHAGCRAGEWLSSAALWGVRPAKPHSFCHWDGGRHARRTGHAGGGNVTATSPPATAARTLWETRTWPQRLPAREPRAPLLLLAEQAADGRLDALLLGGFVERVLAAVAAAGVAHGAVLRAC